MEPVTGPFDADHHGVMKQPVEQSGCDHRVAEHLAPFGEGAVGGEDHGAFLIACADQLEEQVGAFFGQRHKAGLIDDEPRVVGELAEFRGQCPCAVRHGQPIEQLGQGGAVNAFSGFERTQTQSTRQVVIWNSRSWINILKESSESKWESFALKTHYEVRNLRFRTGKFAMPDARSVDPV